MKFVTVEEMRALEANADYFGVSYGELMENAGRAVADAIAARYKPCRTLVVCGRGNNGGDGFVAARLLEKRGFRVTVVLLGKAADVKKGPAADNLFRLSDMGVDVAEITLPEELQPALFSSRALIVDAILGTGSRGVPRGLERRAIELINESKAAKVSVDVPSGLDSYSGTCEVCVKPDLVVTFHAPKKGLESFQYEVADIGIPQRACTYAGPGDLQRIWTRGGFSRKGESGRVLVVGGGPYTGAPALAAMAALRAGADIVSVAAPKRAADIVASFSPNMITWPLSDRHKIVKADLDTLRHLVDRHDVVVVGMGAGRHPETMAAIAEVLRTCEKAVIDADALQPDMPLHGILTPHRGEFKRISGFDCPECGVGDAEGIVRQFAASHKAVTLLKGQIDIVSDGERVKLNGTGNPGMTVGGTGDVLAGIAGAFYCKNPAFEAAVAAAFVSGASGDMVFEDKGFGLVATDVIERIPYVMKKYRG